MDLKIYYSKIREAEKKIPEAFAVVTSRETADGGKPGVYTEVPRRLAAKMIVEGLADLAEPEDAAGFRARQAEAKRVADEQALAAKVELRVVSQTELDRLKANLGKKD
jgi:hypothetical protein